MHCNGYTLEPSPLRPATEAGRLHRRGNGNPTTEGLAAKIGGRIGYRFAQFVTAGKGRPFQVEKILGGQRAAEALAAKGIVPGGTITLEAVAPAQTVSLATREPVVITTDDGLHLHRGPGQAERIRVAEKSD